MATKISQNNRFKAFENEQEANDEFINEYRKDKYNRKLKSNDNVLKIAQALKAREVPTNVLNLSPKKAKTEKLECITTDFFLIASKQSDKVLNATKSENVVIWDYHEGDSQFWYFDGNFLKNKIFSNKVLDIDIEAFEKTSWGKVFLNDPNQNSESQHWTFKSQEFVSKYESKRVEDNNYKDRNLRLDVANLKTANGTGVGAYIRNRQGRGRENQKWYIEFSQDLHLFDKITPSPEVFLVVDTNIWIYYLPAILEIIYTDVHKNCEGYMVYVPWKVSHELSKIKDGNDETATRAQNANKEIDKLSKNNHPRLGLQNGILAKYAFDRFQKMFAPQNSDDEIILCCLQLRVSGKKVQLWTKDISMRFMARSFKDVETFDWVEKNCISSSITNNSSNDQKKFRQINTNLIQSNADSPILMLMEIISNDSSTVESLDEKNIDFLVTEILEINPDMISSLHLELRNNTDSNTTWTARLHFTNIDDYIHTFTNGKGKTYTFGSSFKAKILNAIDDGEKHSTKFEIINPDQNIPRWEINKIIASKLSVTTSIYHGKWGDSNTPSGKLPEQNNIGNGNYYFHAREQDFYDIDDVWVRGQKLDIRNVSKKKPKILDDSKSTKLLTEYQHQPSREIFDKLFKLIRKNISNSHKVVKYSDTVLKNNEDARLTTVKYDSIQNSSSNPEVKQEDESYHICIVKKKIFKFLTYLIIVHYDLIIFFVLCIIAIFIKLQ